MFTINKLLSIALLFTVVGACSPGPYDVNYRGRRSSYSSYLNHYSPPSYKGHTVYFDSAGYPMFKTQGEWYYVPSCDPNYKFLRAHYRSHKKRYLRWYRNHFYTRSYEYENYDNEDENEVDDNHEDASGYSQPEPSDYQAPPAATQSSIVPPAPVRSVSSARITYVKPPKKSFSRVTRNPRVVKPAPKVDKQKRQVARLRQGRHYDSSGRYQGKVTQNGRRYDSSGRYQGKITQNGRRYDSSGRYQGKITKTGRIYDSSGRYQGKVTKDGRRYDSSGRYQGKVTKDGRIYDSSGRYQGKVK